MLSTKAGLSSVAHLSVGLSEETVLVPSVVIVDVAAVINASKGIVKLLDSCDGRLVSKDVTYDMHRIQNKKLKVHFEENGSPASGLVELTFRLSGKGFRTLRKIRNLKTGEIFSTVSTPDDVVKFDTVSEEISPMVSISKSYVAPAPIATTISTDKNLLDGYFIDQDTRRVFTTAHKMSVSAPDAAVKIMMVGPSGYGKTTIPKLFAQASGMGFYRMNCATVRDPEEWFGYREAVEGSTKFFRSEFAQVIESGNCVIVLDEFNRLEPWLHNTLFPLLDDDGKTVVHDEEFSIGPNVIVVGTINRGFSYTGTFELDEALLNRFDFMIEVGPMPFDEEFKVLQSRTGIRDKQASQILKAAADLRTLDVVCSTRTTLLVSKMVVAGLTVREAYQNSVVNRIPNDDSAYTLRKDVIDSLNINCGTIKERSLKEDVFSSEIEEVEAVEQKSLTLTICRKEAVQTIQLAKLLKDLGKKNQEDTGSLIPLRDAADMSKAIAAGETVEVVVPADGCNVNTKAKLSVIAASLKNAGVTGKIHIS